MHATFYALGRGADSLNAWLASTRLVLGRRRLQQGDIRKKILREATDANPAPPALRVYLDAAWLGWHFMLFYSGLLSVAATYAGDRIAGERGHWIGLGAGMFFFTACLIGEVDLVWRLLIVRAANAQIRGCRRGSRYVNRKPPTTCEAQ